MTKSIEMLQRHRNMLFDVAKAISNELKGNEDTFELSPGDVLRLAGVPIPEQTAILAKYKGEAFAQMVTNTAMSIGANTLADALDKMDAEDAKKTEEVQFDLGAAMDKLIKSAADDRADGEAFASEEYEDDHPVGDVALTEEEFNDSIEPNCLIGRIQLAQRSIYLVGERDDEGERRLTLAEFEEGVMVDKAFAGDDIDEAFNHFASEVMNLLMEEKGVQTIAVMEEEATESAEAHVIGSAVSDVMTKLFNGTLEGMRKAS